MHCAHACNAHHVNNARDACPCLHVSALDTRLAVPTRASICVQCPHMCSSCTVWTLLTWTRCAHVCSVGIVVARGAGWWYDGGESFGRMIDMAKNTGADAGARDVGSMIARVDKLFVKRTARKALGMTIGDGDVDLLGSWLGSAAYVSPDGPVTVRDTVGYRSSREPDGDPDAPLVPLLQVRLDDVPFTRDMKSIGIPREGLMQFFIGPDDDYGMMENHYLVRIVPVPKDADPDWVKMTTVRLTEKEYRAPGLYTSNRHMAGYPLNTVETRNIMASNDYRFDGIMDELMDDAGVPAENRDAVYAAIHDDRLPAYDDAMLAGYSLFTQDDPRAYMDKPEDIRTLLSIGTMNGVLTWGDHGYADYLLPRDALKKQDWSKTRLIWDCS